MFPAIRFENVSKIYQLGESHHSLREAITAIGRNFRPHKSNDRNNKLWALQNVNFSVAPAEALGLIGPNGAGKTTILKLLSNITQPSSGCIKVSGRVSALIELGAGFHPDLTGRENIYLNAAILGLPRKEVDRLFDQIVAFSGLERFIDTPVKRYSSGMYVRLGFSVAAHVEPDTLLVDEVLAVGDSQFRQRCTQRIEKLRALGTTIIFVTHNLPLLRSICDKAIFLTNGRVQAHGNVVDVITAYETHLHQEQATLLPELTFDGSEAFEDSSVEITQIDIRGLTKDRVCTFSSTDGAVIVVHFFAREPIKKPNLVIRIVRADGVTCCTIRTSDCGYALGNLENQGRISVAIEPLQLTPGAYLLDVRLSGALDGIPLAHRHSQWFQVTGLNLDPSESGGVFVPHVAWARVEHSD